MFKANQYSKYQLTFIILLGIAWTVYTYYRGVIIASDSMLWESFADTLIKYDFNYFEFLDDGKHRASPLFYSIWISIIAVSKLFLGEHWGIGVVALNLIAAISAAILLFNATWSATGKVACAVFASFSLVLCHDFHLWIPFALSDIIFTAICFSVLYLVLTLYQQPSEPRKRISGVFILALIAFLFRPAWPPLVLFVLFCLSAFYFHMQDLGSRERYCFILKLTLSACFIVPIIFVIHSYLMLNPDKWPFVFFRDYISYVAGDYLKGIVLYGHLGTFHFPPENILDCIFISLHKFLAFFYFDLETNSFKHTLGNYMFFPPVYGLSVFAITRLYKKEEGPSPSNWWCILGCAGFIFLFAFFHSLIQIDYDFRYRVPCLLPLILLATLGLNEFLDKFYKKT